MALNINFEPAPILRYVGLPEDYQPSPVNSPVDFLIQHLRNLPQHLALKFSGLVLAKARTSVPAIRNRRLNYTLSDAGKKKFSWVKGRGDWPAIWEGVIFGGARTERPGQLRGEDERDWAQTDFLGGLRGEIGRLGALLSEYEEEREAERVRMLRGERARWEAAQPQVPEEEDDSDEELPVTAPGDDDTLEQRKTTFERILRERFIYGLLDGVDYDSIDWDDHWDDIGDRDDEDRWFDDEEPNELRNTSGEGSGDDLDFDMETT